MKIEIWREGYQATGNTLKAEKIAEYEADSFAHAIEQHKENHPNTVDDNNRIWGMRLFDNELDARKAFG